MLHHDRVLHRLRRLAQTPRTFANWPQVLRGLAAGRPDVLTFRTRTGLTLTCPNVPGARVPVYEVFAEDCYRIEEFLGQVLDRPVTVVDIGAHVGAFACAVAARAPEATLFCFEPSPTSAAHLRRNAEANGFAGRVVVQQAAVTASVGTAVLADNGGGSALNSLLPSGGDGLAVETTSFDAIVAEAKGPVEIVKIDCEGGEYDLVFGSSRRSWADVSRVIIEYHPHPEHDWPELRAWFAEVGLTVTAERPENPRQGTAWLARTA